MTQRVLDTIHREAGAGNVALTLGYVGTQGSAYPINTVFLWTSGPHEAVMNVGLRPGASISLHDLEERLRKALPEAIPRITLLLRSGGPDQPDAEFWDTVGN